MKDPVLEQTKEIERAAGANPDPITGAPGSHPVGTAAGSASGAAAGAAVGVLVGGPVGAVVGAVAGAVVGGGAGHAAGETVNPTVERDYWSTAYKTRPYYKTGRSFDSYEPAYRFGWENAGKPDFAKKSFDETEPSLQQGWIGQTGQSTLPPWSDSKDAARDAWDRVRSNARKSEKIR
jgi:hypothetical protein